VLFKAEKNVLPIGDCACIIKDYLSLVYGSATKQNPSVWLRRYSRTQAKIIKIIKQ